MGYCEDCALENRSVEIKNISDLLGDILIIAILSSVNFDAGAWNAFAREVIILGLYENNFTIDGCMDGEIAAHEGARTGNLRSASLTDEDFASLYLLATETLDAKSLDSIVV